MMPSLSRFALAALLGAMALPAAAEPWDERVIARHVEREAHVGALDGERLDRLVAAGEKLFIGAFTPADGVGRPFATQAILPTKRKRAPQHGFFRTAGMDATSCAACHAVPIAGGAGDFVANVFVSEGFESAGFDSLDPQFSNERNTNHLFGAGLVELLGREMSADLKAIRSAALDEARRTGNAVDARLESKGVHFGFITAEPDGSVDQRRVAGVDGDLVVKPFGQKGVFVSLRQFTVNALNHHHGMQADERFGQRWTGEDDFDSDGKASEVSDGDVTALVAWQATRPAPGQRIPDDPAWAEAAAHGDALFDRLGCAVCHVRELPLESTLFEDPGPNDAAGTLRRTEVQEATGYDLAALPAAAKLRRDDRGRLLVPLFGDLKRHVIADERISHFGNELLAQRFVERDVFATSELWGIGATAPYGHRGDLVTLDEAIRAHGGEGQASRNAYVAAGDNERSALIAFLKTLVIEP
ncbi:MAG: di-heme oxidoredictase family protein [Rhizobiaceae bacterium]